MSEKKNDGGPAYPLAVQTGQQKDIYGNLVPEITVVLGMSLRDYFAGEERTMPGFVMRLLAENIREDRFVKEAAAFLGVEIVTLNGLVVGEIALKCIAKWRYQCADAMLEAKDV